MGVAGDIVLGFATALEGFTPSTVFASSGTYPTAFKRVPSLRVQGQYQRPRSFVVKLALDLGLDQVEATGIAGDGQYLMRFSVHVAHLNPAQDITAFHALLADEYQEIIDKVLDHFHSGATVNDVVEVEGGRLVAFTPDERWVESAFRFRGYYSNAITT